MQNKRPKQTALVASKIGPSRTPTMEPTSPATPEPLDLPAGVHHLCSCGRSRHGWFCDGAHLGTGRIAYELRLEEPSTVLLCRCGRSGHFPLCDGSHGKAPRRRWWPQGWGT